jgi:tyrosyl-tRNA synthetase
MIMQSYDFYALYQKYGCNLQFGGDDQWSNMIGGMELIRRKLGKEANAMTITLLTNSEGKKMGKTQKGAVWLDAEKTSPYDFYQYWRNVDDGDVIKCMKLLTFLPLSEINEYAKLEGAELNKAKEVLAYELTKLVHGEEEANKAQTSAKALFAGGADDSNMPSTVIEASDFQDGEITVIAMMIKAGLIKSNGEGRRLIQQGGVSLDDEKVTDVFAKVSQSYFEAKGSAIIKKGKKVFHKFTL